MAIKPLTGLAPQWFTPSGEQDSDNPTRFKLKPLDGLTFLDVMSEGKIRDDGAFVANRQGRDTLLKNGLIEWENFDEGGNPLKCNFTNFHRIPAEILAEICNELIIVSSLSGEDEKN
jgi:hypothetical protein